MPQKKKVNIVKKTIARVLLILGLIVSILSFVGSILLLVAHIGLLVIVVAVILFFILAILIVSYGAALVINFFGAFFAAMFGATSYDGIWPTDLGEVIPIEDIQDIGIGCLIYSAFIPLIIGGIVMSFIAMVFAIVALSCLNHSQTKKGGITGGVFAVLSAFTGAFSLLELAGGVLMFIIGNDEYMDGHEPVPDEIVVVRKVWVPATPQTYKK